MRKLTLALLCLVQALAQALTPAAVAALLAGEPALAESSATPTAIINEIYYDPRYKSAGVEFVEIYNPGPQAVNLTGWSLGSGIDYVFAPGTQLPAAAYLVVARNPAALRQVYGVPAVGPFGGKLANEGDDLTLRDRSGQLVDEVAYAMGFPWPTPDDNQDQSISLINALVDNALAGAWRSTPATPGRQNSALVENSAPFVDAVSHAPAAPRAADAVTISAHVADADGVASVRLLLQPVAPGQYIRLQDPQYQTNWTSIPMQPAGGDVYTAQAPAELRVNRMLVRYRIEATDAGGHTVSTPYADDPQPNFAYFVFDGPPPWRGAIKPGARGAIGWFNDYDFSQMRPLPVYNLLAQQADVEDAQFIPNSRLPGGYTGDDYPWRGTLVVNGVVYDHIGFRARGGEYRYMAGKNHWKFDFTRGHGFQAYDDYGRPYAVKWDKLNFSAVLQHAQRKFRGEQGMFEALAYRLFNLAGVPASHTHFVHFRVVDQWDQATTNQYTGDFWGLYLAIENMDGRFLDEHDLPDGNLYDMIDWTGELDNQGDRAVTDRSDLDQFMAAYTWGNPDAAWWRRSFDLDGYYRFRSVLEAVHHYDVHQGKNYYYYLNPDTGKWSILPWDLDLTWSETMFGYGAEPFRDRVLAVGEFNVAYQNNLRELRDLLFNPEQMYPLIDETAALIDTPANGLSMVDADRAQWDYNPILISPYVSDDRALNGRFYEASPDHGFKGMVQLIKDYVVRRTAWIDQALLTDNAFPDTPSLSYAGPAGFPADQLVVRAGGFRDPQGSDTFAAMQWRAAELVRPGLPGYTENSRWRYEIEHTWLSPMMATYQADMAVPHGACRPGVVCRVRVRMMDSSGRWSHWSAPVEFVSGSPTLGPSRDLRVSEIMYKPAPQDMLPSQELEFIELTNSGSTALDLSNMHFSEGIDYTFPTGTSLQPGAFIVLANHAGYFETYYGYAPFAQYSRDLSNQGERIVLLDAFGNPVVNVIYSDDGAWPEAADGFGASLVAVGGDPNSPDAWRASTATGGSPGAVDPLPVVINEVLTDPLLGAVTKVELYNPSASPADVSAWQLTTAAPVVRRIRSVQAIPSGMQLADGTMVPPGGYTVVDVPGSGLPLGNGDKALTLLSSLPTGRLSGYTHHAALSLPLTGTSIGRLVTTDGREHFSAEVTPTWGGPNAGPQAPTVVISALSANPGDGVQWLELTNTGALTASLYNPTSLQPSWLFGGVAYQVPAGVDLPPGGRVVVASGDPSALCLSGRVPSGLRVLGPLALPLGSQGMDLTLLQPTPWGNGWSFAQVDSVEYRAQAPWPSQGAGAVLVRNDLQGFGAEPSNWRTVMLVGAGGLTALASGVLPLGAAADVCSFDAFVNGDDKLEVRWVARPLRDTVSFRLLRSPVDDLAAKVVLATAPAAEVEEQDGPAHEQFIDAQAEPNRTYVYWLQAVAADNSVRDVAMTSVRTPVTLSFAPYIAP